MWTMILQAGWLLVAGSPTAQPVDPPAQVTQNNAKAAPAKVPTDEDVKMAKRLVEEGNQDMVQGNFEHAVDVGKKAVAFNPRSAEAHKILTLAYMRLQKHCEAKVHCKAYIEVGPPGRLMERMKTMLAEPELAQCP